MTKKQKLELTWIGKENRPKLEPRILLEDPAKSYHARHRVASADLFDNRLIFGDNLLALKALEGEFSDKVKCVFIDPPYNTGSGFRYYRLAPSLLEKDKWGNWVINHDYNAAMLAEALCKLEGFTYAPSDAVYWQHGHSTERDFVYVTTASLTHEQLQQLADEVGPDRSLLVLCTAFRARADAYPNLTVKKIPKQVLSRCEWGHDDYSLQVENLPKELPKPGQQSLFAGEA